MATKLDQIITLVCEAHGISREQLLSKARKRQCARPRQIAMSLAREFTRLSLPQIGRKFDRDHTTVLYAKRRICELEMYYPMVAHQMDMFRRRLRGEAVIEEQPTTPSPEDTLRKSWKQSAVLTLVSGGM